MSVTNGINVVKSDQFSRFSSKKEKRNNNYRLTEYYGDTTRVDGELAYILFSN